MKTSDLIIGEKYALSTGTRLYGRGSVGIESHGAEQVVVTATGVRRQKKTGGYGSSYVNDGIQVATTGPAWPAYGSLDLASRIAGDQKVVMPKGILAPWDEYVAARQEHERRVAEWSDRRARQNALTAEWRQSLSLALAEKGIERTVSIHPDGTSTPIRLSEDQVAALLGLTPCPEVDSTDEGVR